MYLKYMLCRLYHSITTGKALIKNYIQSRIKFNGWESPQSGATPILAPTSPNYPLVTPLPPSLPFKVVCAPVPLLQTEKVQKRNERCTTSELFVAQSAPSSCPFYAPPSLTCYRESKLARAQELFEHSC